MKIALHHFAGVQASVHHMDGGEMLPRHRHDIAHTTGIISGATEVTIWRDTHTEYIKMAPGDPDIELPAKIDHEIRALVDDTVIVNMIESAFHPSPENAPGHAAGTGGVMLVDGTIVHAD